MPRRTSPLIYFLLLSSLPARIASTIDNDDNGDKSNDFEIDVAHIDNTGHTESYARLGDLFVKVLTANLRLSIPWTGRQGLNRPQGLGTSAEGSTVVVATQDTTHKNNSGLKGQLSATYVQTTDGRTLVRSIFDGTGHLKTCDVLKSTKEIDNFIKEVRSIREDVTGVSSVDDNKNSALHVPLITVLSKEDTIDQPRIARLVNSVNLNATYFDIPRLTKECQNLQGQLQASFLRQLSNRANATKIKTQTTSDQKPAEPVKVSRPVPVSVPFGRHRRSALLFPGTQWCGRGSRASFGADVGEDGELDRCCRGHDQCPYVIEGFTTRYNLFNYRSHTLSHCDCDEKFYECLRNADSPNSDLIGRMYFNMANRNCFSLQLEKVCEYRSWWGVCQRRALQWSASLEANKLF